MSINDVFLTLRRDTGELHGGNGAKSKVNDIVSLLWPKDSSEAAERWQQDISRWQRFAAEWRIEPAAGNEAHP